MRKRSPLEAWLRAATLVAASAAARGEAAPGGPASGAAPAAAAGAAVDRPIGFNREIRPLLSENCFFCHGPDKAKRKAGLRLDDRQAAIDDGAIVPGKPEESELFKRLVTKDPDDVMPPPASHKTVKPAEIELLRRWIAQGAPYEPHWAYVTVRRPAVPAAPGGTHPIDAFVRRELAARGLAPSPPADRRTLLRRLSLDLVGLPPTPEELAAFEADGRPDAWGRQVDRLLASPRYGERMAVPWLDAVRFADTVGYHGDQNQNVFPYRDWVIDAFNRNERFDRFTIAQLAGDLLPRPTTADLVATGFNRLNMVTREGGAQPKEYLAKYMADRVRAVGTAWLGSTLGCAECHDHKYDPISAKDFYALGAFFADVKEWGVYNDYDYTPNPDLRGWSNEHPFPPERLVPSPYQARRLAALREERDALWAATARRLEREPEARAALRAFRVESRRFLAKHPDGFEVVAPASVDAPGLDAVVESGGVVLVRGAAPAPAPAPAPPAVTARPGSQGPAAGAPATKKLGKPEPSVAVAIRPSGRIAALRLELLPRPEHGGRILRAGKKSTVVHIDAALARADGTKVPIGFHFSDAREKERLYDNGREVFDLSRGWRTAFALGDARHAAVFELAAPLTLGAGEAIELRVKNDAVGAIRVSVSPFAGFGATAASPIAIPGAKRPTVPEALRGGGRRPVQELFVLSTAWDPATRGRLRALHRAELPLYEGRAPTLVTVAQPARPVRLLPRGNWQDDGGPLLEPATPEFLPGAKPAPGRRLTRLDLARWLVSRDNPLTARVLVNRLWRQLFGAGLSGVLNDLGAQGEPPSYPELLDWLAAELMDSGWDVKRLVRLVVTSETYRQDSTARAKLVELDPGNRLLARQSQRRLDAEFVRDNALFVAGLLDPEIGGPSAFPYQPGGYYENLEFPRRDWIAATDARQYRRGLYVHWQRTFLHPMLANFDAPSREECTADRPPSNTPQQALTLLNDPSFVEAARAFAERLLTEGRAQDDGARIARAYEQALGRAPREVEQESLRKLLGAQREHYGSHPEDARKLLAVGLPRATNLDPAEHAAWTSVCRVVLNLYEAITRL